LTTTSTFNRLGELIKQERTPGPSTDSMMYDVSGNMTYRKRNTQIQPWTVKAGLNLPRQASDTGILSRPVAYSAFHPPPRDLMQHPYERILEVGTEEIELSLRFFGSAPWGDFLLNPRRLRGSDFLMRWSQGRWSEERLIQAVEATSRYFAIPYGPSGVAPDNPRDFELYFERLENAGLGGLKRPDLLIFPSSLRADIEKVIQDLGGLPELPFTPEEDSRMVLLLQKSSVAVECENSLWKARQMPGYGTQLTPQRRLGGKPGVKKSCVLPTVIIKEEDRTPLNRWQVQRQVPIHIWHVFYDQAYGLSLERAESLVAEGLIQPTVQVFQAPGGATTRKAIYKYPYLYAYLLGEAREEPTLIGACIEDKNGHILPYVRFDGGTLGLSSEALQQLDLLAQMRGR
jgi:hypothetical protein